MMKFFKNNKRLSILIVPIIYLVVVVFTLKDYGINWDTPKHLTRGQSYLHFILTGKHDFLEVPPYPQMKGAPDYVDNNVDSPTRGQPAKENSIEAGVRRSYFQSDFYTFDYFMTKHEHTHPEVNGVLLAISNYLFFQKLGLVEDIEAYHLFIVLVTFGLSLGIALWTHKNFGLLVSLVSSASLVMYPLVFAESHFNVKDTVLMSFFGLAILTFWYGFSKNKSSHILVSAVLAGFSLGTKFNTFFLPVILAPWALSVLWQRYKNAKAKKFNLTTLLGGRSMFISMLFYPIIIFGILYVFSPYLWSDPVNRFLEIVGFYREIGRSTPGEQSQFIVGGWNTYPLVWIAYTTPIPILLLSFVGLPYSVFLFVRKRSETALLVLLWFLVPIFRAIWPGMNIYGGVRQIMEFVPAMAILAGIGALLLVRLSKVFIPIIVFSLIFVGYELFVIHPNQNVYFNQLVGGLPGAYDKKIPSWGNSYGNIYLQGIEWLNKNAEPNAKVALGWNYISAIPRLKLRQDIYLDNAYWSGPRHEGEYLIETYDSNPLQERYKYAYYETFLEPVYQVKVDGVPLLKVWKNSFEYSKAGFGNETIIKPESVLIDDVQISPGAFQKRLKIQFAKEIYLAKLIIDHSPDNCEAQNGVGFVEIFPDGKSWTRDQSPLIDPESPYLTPDMDENTFVFMFPARLAWGIFLNSEKAHPCILKDYKVTIWGLEKQ